MHNVHPPSKKLSDSAANATQPANPSVRISWGELLDRVTILEIKGSRLRSAGAAANVARELAMLQASAAEAYRNNPDLAPLKKELTAVNELLWDVEDKIRAKEAAKQFDPEFIELARAVYINNDKRAELKRQINRLMNSELIEEKQYTAYS
jgi:Family of unknown function (DUF6165)